VQEITAGRGIEAYRQVVADWKRSGSPAYPPSLPLLAVAVLAASRMAADGQIRNTNYYARFRELFGLEGGGGFPGYDRVFPALWRGLHEWLTVNEGNKRGSSTIRGHARLVNIGYSLSQTLFRASDRQALSYFFHSIGMIPGDPLPTPMLVKLLRFWVTGGRRLSPGAAHMVEDPGFEAQVAAIVASEALIWDGRLRDERGHIEGLIRLAWDWEERLAITCYAERRDDFPSEFHSRAPNGTIINLTSHLRITGWYDQPVVDVTPGLLDHGIRLAMGRVALRLPVDDVHLMRFDDRLGTWVSVGRMVPGAAHTLVARSADGRAIADALRTLAAPGWTGPASSQLLPSGWSYFRGITWSGHEGGSRETDVLAHLIPTTRSTVRLVGGLRLSIGDDFYLRGGEPDISLPISTLGASFAVDGLTGPNHRSGVTNGTTSELERPPGLVRLRHWKLQEGRHVAQVENEKFAFTSLDGRLPASPERSDAIQWTIKPKHGRDDTSAGAIRVCGGNVAGVPSMGRNLLRLPVGKRIYLILGSVRGQYLEHRLSQSDTRLRAAIDAPEFELVTPFPAVWVLMRSPFLGWQIQMVASMPPTYDASGRNLDVEHWARALDRARPQDPTERDLWERYRTVARGAD
jgi:hypothetical protein